MKYSGKFKYFAICTAILFVLFSAVSIIVAANVKAIGFGNSFWIGYIFAVIAFAGILCCGYKAFQADNAEKMFLNMPLVRISYTGLIVLFILAMICMLVPVIPGWVTAIISLLVLGFTALAVTKASAAAEAVEEVERKVEQKTNFIRMLTADSQALMNSAKTDDVKAELRKVYEAVRYSDPMSSADLEEVEGRIVTALAELKGAVEAGESDGVKTAAEELIALVQERNVKCKAGK